MCVYVCALCLLTYACDEAGKALTIYSFGARPGSRHFLLACFCGMLCRLLPGWYGSLTRHQLCPADDSTSFAVVQKVSAGDCASLRASATAIATATAAAFKDDAEEDTPAHSAATSSGGGGGEGAGSGSKCDGGGAEEPAWATPRALPEAMPKATNRTVARLPFLSLRPRCGALALPAAAWATAATDIMPFAVMPLAMAVDAYDDPADVGRLVCAAAALNSTACAATHAAARAAVGRLVLRRHSHTAADSDTAVGSGFGADRKGAGEGFLPHVDAAEAVALWRSPPATAEGRAEADSEGGSNDASMWRRWRFVPRRPPCVAAAARRDRFAAVAAAVAARTSSVMRCGIPAFDDHRDQLDDDDDDDDGGGGCGGGCDDGDDGDDGDGDDGNNDDGGGVERETKRRRRQKKKNGAHWTSRPVGSCFFRSLWLWGKDLVFVFDDEPSRGASAGLMNAGATGSAVAAQGMVRLPRLRLSAYVAHSLFDL